jgi:hypothetical protein
MVEQLIAKLTYTCPNRNQAMTVGPEDYHIPPMQGDKPTACVRCLCGKYHDVLLGHGSY